MSEALFGAVTGRQKGCGPELVPAASEAEDEPEAAGLTRRVRPGLSAPAAGPGRSVTRYDGWYRRRGIAQVSAAARASVRATVNGGATRVSEMGSRGLELVRVVRSAIQANARTTPNPATVTRTVG